MLRVIITVARLLNGIPLDTDLNPILLNVFNTNSEDGSKASFVESMKHAVSTSMPDNRLKKKKKERKKKSEIC